MAKVYPLEQLLSVRRYREELAKNAVQRAEQGVQAAETQLCDCQKSLRDYAVWRVEEENRRYDAIMGKNIELVELDRFKVGLAVLGAEEMRHAEAVDESEKHLDECREALQQARNTALFAQKDTSKILMHKDIWLEAMKLEAERQEDLELEEFISPPVPNAESDDV